VDLGQVRNPLVGIARLTIYRHHPIALPTVNPSTLGVPHESQGVVFFFDNMARSSSPPSCWKV